MASTDAQLLLAWRDGDRASGDLLVRRHYTSVLRYFELNATWAADDLAQRTFEACVEGAQRLRSPDLFRPYLFGIARRELVKHRRRLARSRELHSFEETESMGPPRTQLSTLIVRSSEHVLLLRSLASLPSATQLLLVLFYWYETSTANIALHFDIAETTARTRLHRARAKLRERYAKARGGRLDDAPSLEQLEALLDGVLPTSEARG